MSTTRASTTITTILFFTAAFLSPAPEFRKAEGDSAASVGRRSRLGDEADLGKIESVGDAEDGEGAAVGGAVTDALVVVWVFSHSRSEVFRSVSLPSWLRGSDVVEQRVVMVTGTGFVFLVILFCFLVNLIVFFIVVVGVAFVILVVMATVSVFHVSVVLWKNIVPIVD